MTKPGFKKKKEIENLRKLGLTYQKIADKLGISKQRVHQLYKNYAAWSSSSTKVIRFATTHTSCENCGTSDKLQTHHKDGNRKNNDWSNLKRLCQKCHYKEESVVYRNFKKPSERNRGKFYNCRICQKLVWHSPSKRATKKNIYCSKKCYGISARVPIEIQKERERKYRSTPEYQNRNRQNARNYYHNVLKVNPELYAKHLERNTQNYHHKHQSP